MKPHRTLSLALLTGLLLSACGSSDSTRPTVTLDAAPSAVTQAGKVTLRATASDDVGVARVTFYRNGTQIGEDATAPYEMEDTVGAAQNGTVTYRAVATDLSGNTGEATDTVTVNVDGTRPTVTATATQTSPSQFTVTATATDDVGVTRVEFYEGGQLVGTDTTAPYTLERSYTAAQGGSRTITVRAYDAQGNFGETTVTLTVDAPPAVSLSLSSETVARSGPVTVTATATDDKGVARVEFLVDGQVVANDTAAPYSTDITFTFLQNGERVVTARAYDTAGQTSEARKTVTVALDAGEGNDTPATATVLPIPQVVDARIAGAPRDFDYYRFTGAAGDRLRLTVRSQSVNPSSTLDPYVMVLMPDGKTVLEKDDDGGQGLESDLRFDLPQAGTYYVVVTSFDIHDDENATDDRLSNTYRLELTRR